MELEETLRGDYLVIKVPERRLDHLISEEFKDHVLARAAAHRGTIVLDLTAVEFIDSSGLGALVGVRKRLGWSVRIVLAGVRSPVFRVFEIARMTDVFSFYTSTDAACQRAEV